MRTSWANTGDDGSHQYVDVTRTEVIVGHHYGSGHTDYAGAVSHAAFLAGEYQDLVRARHGEAALAEVLAAIAGIDEVPAFREQRARIARIRDALAAIPLDAGLLATRRDPATVTGTFDETRSVASTSRVLLAERAAISTWPRARPQQRVRVELGNWVEGCVAARDWFLLAVGQDWRCVGPDGALDEAGRAASPEFGADLRVTGVARHGELLLVDYAWFDPSDGPRGVLRLEPGVGLIARGE